MTGVLITLWAATVVFAVAGVAVAPWVRRDQVMRGLLRKRIVLFCHDGSVIDGILARRDERTFVLVDVHSRGQAVPIPAAAGELLIDRARVAYTQYVAAEQASVTSPLAAVPGYGAPAAA